MRKILTESGWKAVLDKPTKTPEQIAAKHGVPLSHINKQLAIGIEVEKEHTSSTKAAREIALDHLGEKHTYYTNLRKMERSINENTSQEVADKILAHATKLKKSRIPHHHKLDLSSYSEKQVIDGCERHCDRYDPERVKGGIAREAINAHKTGTRKIKDVHSFANELAWQSAKKM